VWLPIPHIPDEQRNRRDIRGLAQLSEAICERLIVAMLGFRGFVYPSINNYIYSYYFFVMDRSRFYVKDPFLIKKGSIF
jgi:hypothetical protein